MKCYSKEIQKQGHIYKTAGVKARDDTEAILGRKGFEEVLIPSLKDDRVEAGKVKKALAHFQIRNMWRKKTAGLKKGDLLFIQYPTIEHSIFLASVFRDLRKRGVKIIFLIHDLEFIRLAVAGNENMTKTKSRRLELEQRALHFGNRIIVHNNAMIDKMVELGFDRRKLVSLDIFDYLIPEFTDDFISDRMMEKDKPVIIAGNLRKHKAVYVYSLPDTVRFNLFGVDYEDEGKENIDYRGSFLPDELPRNLDGSFGLVWDGDRVDTCEGVYGRYLRINNPHKTSLYLASGFPVIIWKEAALAEFVRENRVGIEVESLYDIPEAIQRLSKEEYDELTRNVLELSKKLREGYFLSKALKNCCSRRNDK